MSVSARDLFAAHAMGALMHAQQQRYLEYHASAGGAASESALVIFAAAHELRDSVAAAAYAMADTMVKSDPKKET